VKAPVAVAGLAEPRARDRLAGEPFPEAKLAVGEHALGAVAALELDRDVGAGKPVVELADPDRRRLKAEAGVGDPCRRGADQRRISGERLRPFQ
jgi:hypothetical protein